MQRGLFRYDVTACETKVCLLCLTIGLPFSLLNVPSALECYANCGIPPLSVPLIFQMFSKYFFQMYV